MIPYTPPKYGASNFNCPHCQAYAYQTWSVFYNFTNTSSYEYAKCQNCRQISIWVNPQMHYPLVSVAPLPNPDMPPEIKKIFEEARKISSLSPRASAGLLRVCVEQLTKELGEIEGKLNTRIANLVKKGLSPEIQKALDVVRVTGNGELHVGQIEMNDNPEIAKSLFNIVNIIVQRMISDKNQIDDMYKQLPQEKLDGIANRDNNSQK
jgi:hypothetical protein